jgi:hypothetical protein
LTKLKNVGRVITSKKQNKKIKTNMKIPYTISSRTVTAMVGSRTFTAANDHPNFFKIRELLLSDSTDTSKLAGLFDISVAVNNYGRGKIEVKHGVVYFNGNAVNNYLTDKVVQFMSEGIPVQPLLNFASRLMANPSKRAVDELYKFLEHKNMPITPEGYFRAYKGVMSNFYSKHANKSTVVLQGKVNEQGQLFNGIGETIEIERNNVCDDANKGCAEGIHAGSLKYATDWAGSDGHLMIVEIDPADVVSVPNDCDCQKLRTCKYRVVAESFDKAPLSDTFTGYEDGDEVPEEVENAYADGYDDGYEDGYQDGEQNNY